MVNPKRGGGVTTLITLIRRFWGRRFVPLEQPFFVLFLTYGAQLCPSILANSSPTSLASYVLCGKCGGRCKLTERDEAPDGFSFQCRKGGHVFERKVRVNSFFNRFVLPLPDVLNFMKLYLDGHTLHKCSKLANIDYKKMAIQWAKSTRDSARSMFGEMSSARKWSHLEKWKSTKVCLAENANIIEDSRKE